MVMNTFAEESHIYQKYDKYRIDQGIDSLLKKLKFMKLEIL